MKYYLWIVLLSCCFVSCASQQGLLSERAQQQGLLSKRAKLYAAAKEKQEKRKTIKPPESHMEEGWAFPGRINFAGMGWQGPFRTRPQNKYDHACKIHDLIYHLNDISIAEVIFKGTTKEEHSIRAKADYFYYSMVRQTGIDHCFNRFLHHLSGAIFKGKSQYAFVRNDGFRNPLNEPEILEMLKNPDAYLMIPYSDLPEHMQPRTEEGKRHFLQKVEFDESHGYLPWLEKTYGPVLDDLRSL